MSIDDATRRQLARFARCRWARHSRFSAARPTKWHPHQVINPASGAPFTNAGAWELIAAKLESGHDVEAVPLWKPAGETGYVMKIEIDPAAPRLYVKVQLRAEKILGRSFHYSRHE